jgi:hypothetical protein
MRYHAASWGWLQRHAGRGRLGGLVDTSFEAVLPCSIAVYRTARSGSIISEACDLSLSGKVG